MSVSLSLEIDDDVSEQLAAMMRRVADVEPVLDEIGGSQAAEVQNRFETQRGPDGAAWRGLSELTLAKRGGRARTLRDTGALYDSQVHQVSDRTVSVGTNSVYGAIHQFGGQAGRGRKVTIPARPYLGLSEKGKAEILAILRDHVGGDA